MTLANLFLEAYSAKESTDLLEVYVRDDAIKEKVNDLQSELADWAVQQGLIQSGDTILLSYTIHEERVAILLNMRLSEFFSLERCKSARARAFAKSLEHEGEIVTVRDLLEYKDIVDLFRYTPNMGTVSRDAMIDIMEQAGIPLPQTKEWIRLRRPTNL